MNPPSRPADPSLASAVRSSWHAFLETYEPLRSDLYRYCRHLTRSPWDAEDLAQDEAARRTVLYGMLFGSACTATADVNGGIEARFMQGVLPAPPCVEADGDRVARYFFNPDFIAEVCGELGLSWRSNGYRWFLAKG